MITTTAVGLMEVMSIGIWEELSALKPTLHIRFTVSKRMEAVETASVISRITLIPSSQPVGLKRLLTLSALTMPILGPPLSANISR